MTRVALVSGFWGQNIGNAFFNLGGRATLEAAGTDPFFVQDMPAYATFRNEEKGNFDNAYPILLDLDFDVLVLQGPLFTRNFANIWLDQLREMAAQGKRWAVLGGAFRKYTQEEIDVVRLVTDAVPPVFVSTRDVESHNMLESLSLNTRSGVDSAFFLPEAFRPPKSRTSTVALCFDHYGEPELVPDASGDFVIGGQNFRLERDGRSDAMADKSKAHAIAYQVLSRRTKRPIEIAGYKVIRPDHRTNPHLPVKIYRDANAIASDEPWTYATVYANSTLTISDRVHACVATLAYGGEAFLHNPSTRRSALFEAIGAGEIESRPVTIDMTRRAEHFELAHGFVAQELG